VKTFLTRVDLADDRQVKQNINTETTFSGSINTLQYTTLGQTYNDLQTGYDIATSAITDDNLTFYVTFTFTGTTGSTTYFGITSPYTSIIPNLPTITDQNYNGTNFSAFYFDPIETVVVDGNSFDITFSGSQFIFNVYDFNYLDISGTTFSGLCVTDWVYTLSARTYDWYYIKSGSTTWLSVLGRLETQKLTVESNDVPTSSSSTGITGTITWDSSAIYVCVAPNSWKKANLSTF
jgi:hypothetical protein